MKLLNKAIAGIFGGIGEYLDVDSVVLRVIAIFIGILSGILPFLLAYIITCLIIPKKV